MVENFFPIQMIRDLLPGQAVVQTLATISCQAAEYCSFGNGSAQAITCEASGDGVQAHETQISNDDDSRTNAVLRDQWRTIQSQKNRIAHDMTQHEPRDMRKYDPRNGYPKLRCNRFLQIRGKVTNIWKYGTPK